MYSKHKQPSECLLLALDFRNCLASSRPGTDFHDASRTPPHPANEVELHHQGKEKTSELSVLEHEPAIFRALRLVLSFV